MLEIFPRINTYGQTAIPWVGHGIAPKTRTRMKTSATQKRKLIRDPDPTAHITAGALDNSGNTAADKEDLAKLAWKHFAQEITETLREVQEALAPEHSTCIQRLSHRK
jgi:hypothetical protein